VKPGRFLDVLIAEKIFGLTDLAMPDDTTPTASFLIQRETKLMMTPDYSTDIAAAWLVVERMLNSGKEHMRLAHYQDYGDMKKVGAIGIGGPEHLSVRHWSCWLPGCFQFDVKGETAPHAICLAALHAVGHPID
jgi:hypothetical protein